MAKKKNSPSLLDNVSDNLGLDNPMELEEVTNMNDLVFDKQDVDDLTNKEPDPTKGAEDNNGVHDDDSDIPEEVLERINSQNSSTDNGNSDEEEDIDPGEGLGDDNSEDDNNPEEAAGVGSFFDAFAEALNWDVSEEEKPTTVDGLIKYIEGVVEENSTPQYADDRIAKLDQYVKNGGKFEDFYESQQKSLQYDTLDMEDESNLKAVVREYMKLQGFTDEQINNKIERYEYADMLEDEANDAKERLQQIKAEQLRIAEEEQARIRQTQEEQARQFMTDLNTSIASLSNIRGIAVPKEDRKALLDYITKTDADGLTQYQKDFNGNIVNNLIESAYFTMKGDALLGEAKRNGQTSAASKLREMLRHQTKNHSTKSASEEKTPQAWEIASKYL